MEELINWILGLRDDCFEQVEKRFNPSIRIKSMLRVTSAIITAVIALAIFVGLYFLVKYIFVDQQEASNIIHFYQDSYSKTKDAFYASGDQSIFNPTTPPFVFLILLAVLMVCLTLFFLGIVIASNIIFSSLVGTYLVCKIYSFYHTARK